MKGSVGILKRSVGILKGSVGILKGSIGILKSSVGILKGSVGILIHWYYEHWYFERWYFEPLPEVRALLDICHFFTDNILGSKIFTQNIEIIAHLHPLCAVIFWISKLVEWLLELLRLKLDMFNFNLRKSESHCMYVILLKSRFRLYSSSKLFPQFLSEFHRFPIWHMSGWKALCQKKSR